MTIKIYDHNGIGLTSLFSIDFENLSYNKVLMGVGSMEFTVRVDSDKITKESIQVYNRVKLEENGKVVFSGYIAESNINLETITVRCFGLVGLLKVRVTPFNYSLSGDVNTVVGSLISKANENEITGIIAGDMAGIGNVSRAYNGDTIYDAIDDAITGTANQWKFNHETGQIDIKPLIGQNLSSEIILQYDTRIIALANLSSFSVVDKGDAVTTVSVGRVNASTNNISDTALIDKYGRVEKNTAYRTISNTDLATQLTSELSESEYSPELTLLPIIPDIFDVGDILGVKLYNKIIDINTAYQVLEKEVVYQGEQKIIKIKVNKKQTDILDIIKNHSKEIRNLSNHL